MKFNNNLKINKKLGPVLLEAVKRRSLKSINMLINNGVDINYADEQGKTALHLSICIGALDIVQ